MSTNNEQPLSRRAAREAAERAAREAEQGAQGSAPSVPPQSPLSAPQPSAPQPSAPPASAPIAPSAESDQRMRRRDFRPPSEQPARGASFAPTLEEDAPLEYRTERPLPPAPSSHVAEPAPGARQPSAPHVISEHTLSRRELRSRRDGEAPPAAPPQPPAPPAPPVPPAPPASTATLHEAPVHETPLHRAPVPPPLIEPHATPEQAPAQSSSAPTGSHWSVGAHDDEDPFTNTFSREVGAASSSTNALVLPQMPSSNLSGPVAGTGEIIVTGMIEVPGIVTSTGTVPSIHDSPGIDDFFEPGDVEVTSTGSAPVSALHAVSGHTGSNSMMSGKPPRSGNTLTTVLVASTVVMAVVAIGLFVLAAVNGLF